MSPTTVYAIGAAFVIFAIVYSVIEKVRAKRKVVVKSPPRPMTLRDEMDGVIDPRKLMMTPDQRARAARERQ